jgi:hypothetical protein
MLVREYSFIEPRGGFAAEFDAWIMDRPIAAERLFRAVEALVATDLDHSCRATPADPNGLEIYLAPPAVAMSAVPGAACLMVFDHAHRTFELVHLEQDYGGPGERQQWQSLCARAAAILAKE